MQHEEDISHYLCVFYHNMHDNNWEVVVDFFQTFTVCEGH